jgi:hypothetical protein
VRPRGDSDDADADAAEPKASRMLKAPHYMWELIITKMHQVCVKYFNAYYCITYIFGINYLDIVHL